MLTTRRGFLVCTAAAAGVVLVRRPALARWTQPGNAGFFDWKRAGELPVAFGEGGNALLVLGDGGAALIDCKNSPFGETLRREASERGKLELVINTHHHADHTGGNHAFTPDLPVLAHKNAKPRIAPQLERYVSQAQAAVRTLESSAHPDAPRVREDARRYLERAASLTAKDFEPTRLAGDREEVTVGGRAITLHHFGPGHTDNDLVVQLTDRNLVHCGDLLFHKMHPFLDRSSGGSAAGWIENLGKIIGLCDDTTVVVPGHGEITDVSGLKGLREYLERTRDAVAAAVKEGKTRQEALALELPQYKELGLGQMRTRTLGAIYDELTERP